ncbi:MAG TPA: glycosyltransferase family 4 protein [Polyangiaceae bacterium]|nr:glycosyltransferase family 4 protein [Polyangiaceae bacterium]
MKILFVAPYLPSPPRFGGQRRMDGLMRGLAANHEVSILSFNSTDPYTQQSLDATRLFCQRVTTLPDLDPRSVAEKRRLQMRSLLSLHSFEHLQVKRRADFQAQIDQQLAEQSYDVVQVEFANMASYRFTRQQKKPLLVLDEHNIEYDLQRRTAGSADGASRKLYNSLNWRKLGWEEKAAWRRFDGVLLTSQRDAGLLSGVSPTTTTAVIPNGVNVEQFQPSSFDTAPDQLLFFGANNYFPNHDALLYFIDEILPKVVAARPNVKLSIVGPGAQPALLARQSRHVEVVGFVDDVMPHLERASAVVVPLRIGGGTRLKIVEAMAKSKAIVSTRIGAEGLDVSHEHDVLLADSPDDFAQQILRVLADPKLAQKLGQNARTLAEERYAWTAVVRQLVQFYEQLLSR